MGNSPSLILSYHMYKNNKETYKLIYNSNLYGKRHEKNSKHYIALSERKRKKENSKNISRGFPTRGLFRFKYLLW